LFARAFAEALAAADICLLTDIYPAREKPIEGVTSGLIKEEAARLGKGHFTCVGVKKNAVEAVADLARPGDMILIIGAGSITHIRTEILERLRK
jgi:UDP-N-acetylmuramate--alanine ligase